MRRWILTLLAAFAAFGFTPTREPLPFTRQFPFDGSWSQSWQLAKGQAVEISIRIDQPSSLPANARIEARWTGPDLGLRTYQRARGDLTAKSTADWQKTLHELDPDVYLVYQAPKAGTYTLTLATVTNRAQGKIDYARDTGFAPLATPLPAITPAVQGQSITIDLRPIAELQRGQIALEAEPNNTPEQALRVPFAPGDQDQVIRVIGSADELEYFNNAQSGKGPDDWYRIEFRGKRPKILTANLQLVEPVVPARMRIYQPGTPSAEQLNPKDPAKGRKFGNANPVPYVHPPVEVIPGPEPIYSYYEGRDINERIHQQDDNFRSFVTRTMKPGGVYYLRVEANQPAYELELRLLDPAPFSDPRQAIQRAIYYHTAEVDAWLIHRPRNIAAHWRVRDSTSVLGENCMSCHTQSGVWGVADALRNGYRLDGTVQNWRRLVNTMYESLRPTNKLEDAAVNTSLAPLDLGDAPAGSRVAGRNIVLHERATLPKALHRYQQRRTANYVLQTADPKGINAAGKGSNFGPNVVFKFAGEILHRAWRDTGDPKYFWGLEEKAKKIVATGDYRIAVSDDLGHRIEFFYRLWPRDYPALVQRLTGDADRAKEAQTFQEAFEVQVRRDMQRLIALQQDGGGWGFDIGMTPDKGKTWAKAEEQPDAAPTAVALIALQAAGRSAEDPVVSRGVKWLLANQFPYGLWNEAAQTGFVTTAYAIRALSQLYPAERATVDPANYRPARPERMLETLARVRQIQTLNESRFSGDFQQAAASHSPQVRYFAYLGIGGSLAHDGVPALIQGLGDPVKSCREAAFWSLRQLLLDDAGWDAVFAAWKSGDDRTRQSILQALVTRADLEGPKSRVDRMQLAGLLAEAMQDRFAGVRGWAYKAAWHWWVWNPALRRTVNEAWTQSLLRPESNAHVETALRYSTAAFLMVNGHIANQTGEKNVDQQYQELAGLYRLFDERRTAAPPADRLRFDRRLTAVAASHFQERGNDGGPGQMGYSTPGAAEVMGKIVLATFEAGSGTTGIPWDMIALQGAANVAYAPLEAKLLDLLQTAGADTVAVAARALSNPRALSLPARPETLRALIGKLDSFLSAGRNEDAQALANFLGRIRWDFEGIEAGEEKEFYRLLTPSEPPARSNRSGAALKPAPEPESVIAGSGKRNELLGQVLSENPTLQRRAVFDEVGGDPRFWLPSTEWMLNFREGGTQPGEAPDDAIEAETLTVDELTSGRVTEQIVPAGLASRNTVLWWREGTPGGKLTFRLQVPQAGRYHLVGAFLSDRDNAVVQFALNGARIGDPTDFFAEDLSATGPVSLGVHEFKQGANALTLSIAGANPSAEKLYIAGIDYIRITPDTGAGDLFQRNRKGHATRIDPLSRTKDEVVDMFTAWFQPGTPEKTRTTAVTLANKTVLRRNPKVRTALANYVDRETSPELKERIENILNSDDAVYGKQLERLIREQGPSKTAEVRPLEATSAFIRDILQFRDTVFVELNNVNEEDNRACISCHGVPGRVPTLFLNPPDAAGYIPPDKLLENYRTLQQRVDLADIERSKLLRKPLNIQSGQEDGHQGGQRYHSTDSGYQVIRAWVEGQVALQRASPQ